TPFVDAARILALANGIRETGTTQRLAQLKQRGVLDALDADAYEEAYQFIQLLRMQQHQSQESLQRAFSNRLAPASLNQLDQRILRQSSGQAQRLQSSLSTRYQLCTSPAFFVSAMPHAAGYPHSLSTIRRWLPFAG